MGELHQLPVQRRCFACKFGEETRWGTWCIRFEELVYDEEAEECELYERGD